MWCFGYPLDFENISANELQSLIGRFYAEGIPKHSEIKQKPGQNIEYHKNSSKSIRSAIYRYLQDLGRDCFDEVRRRDFSNNNNILDEKLEVQLIPPDKKKS